MSKKRKIDYIVELNDFERLRFRFYPKQSHCHSFGDEPPKDWSDVYKVYYSYAIIKQWRFDSEDQWESKLMFYEPFDECSIIDQIGNLCLLLADGHETFERKDGERVPFLNERIFPIGMGTEWTISKRVCTEYAYFEDEEDITTIYYTFMLFDYSGKGFKFTLEDKDVKAFGEYLLGCCEYMLAHGDPI